MFTTLNIWKLNSSPTDDLGKNALGMVEVGKLPPLNSMQVSIATLRVATTRHHHTGDTYHTVFYSHQQKKRRSESKNTLQAQKTLKTNRTFSHSW